MMERARYRSSFAGKGARLADVKTILQALDTGQTMDQVRRAVIEEDLLDSGSLSTRDGVA